MRAYNAGAIDSFDFYSHMNKSLGNTALKLNAINVLHLSVSYTTQIREYAYSPLFNPLAKYMSMFLFCLLSSVFLLFLLCFLLVLVVLLLFLLLFFFFGSLWHYIWMRLDWSHFHNCFAGIIGELSLNGSRIHQMSWTLLNPSWRKIPRTTMHGLIVSGSYKHSRYGTGS